MRCLAALFLCFAGSAQVAAKPAPYALATQFSGDRYVGQQIAAPGPPTRHVARGKGHKARYYYRTKKRHPAPSYRKPGTIAPLTLAEGFGREIGRARPRAWCGWWLSHHLGMNNRNLWLARNWAAVGRNAGGPQVGAVVVWRHHVGIITGRSGSKWVIKSGNDGHTVRERPRSIAGAIAFRFAS